MLVAVLLASTSWAKTVAYAVAIGINEPPLQSRTALPTLRFADDDAVRYDAFFARFTERRWLLSRFDLETQRRYRSLSAQAPSLGVLRMVLGQIATAMKVDLERGDSPVLYLTYSGHGAQDVNGTAFLALDDEPLTQRVLYEELLPMVPATFVHLLVDACHAEAVVGSRGLFDREVDATVVTLSEGDVAGVVANRGLRRFPQVGVLLATTADQESHEWSRVQSGIFTHEVLSGLSGAADVNSDGVVEYSEVQAFVMSANRDIKDPRALPQIVSTPPASNTRVPLVVLSSLRNVAFLEGNASSLGHFHIELDDGQRYLDANIAADQRLRIAVPAQRTVFVVTSSHEAELTTEAGEVRPVSSLPLKPRSVTGRGSLDATLRDALFQSPFGASYYKGFVDSTHGIPVPFSVEAYRVGEGVAAPKRAVAIGLLSLGAAALVTSVSAGVVAANAKSEFESTDFQRTASEAQARYAVTAPLAIGAGIGAAACGLVGWLLWPASQEPAVALVPVINAQHSGVAILFRGP